MKLDIFDKFTTPQLAVKRYALSTAPLRHYHRPIVLGPSTTTWTSQASTTAARLNPREIVTDLSANSLAPSQYPTITTQWWPSQRPDGIVTYIQITYTQTFATTVLDQFGSPRNGRIILSTGAAEVEVEKENIGEELDKALVKVGDKMKDVGEGVGEIGEGAVKAGGGSPKGHPPHKSHELENQAVKDEEGCVVVKIMLVLGLLTCAMLLME